MLDDKVVAAMRDYAAAPIPLSPLLDRSVSTSLRLSRQGFRESGRITTFAVRSIRHGSLEWHTTLRPFVADLAFFSLVQRRFSACIEFRPYTCHAAVLFVDLSGYSKITAAIGHRGAHTLSNIVNAYLSRLLAIVRAHGGDVIKFAGDAVLVVWFGSESDLEMNLLAAALCVLELQEKAGDHPVEGTSMSFRIHCGLTCGVLESEIFAAPNHVHMQRLYHSIGGDCLEEISELVELAQPGEVCITDTVADYLGGRGTYRSIPGVNGCQILTALTLSPSVQDAMEMQVMESILLRESLRRSQTIEEEFIHPTVVKLLSHGGLTPTHIAQMRNLCVLFIAMTSNGSSVNWLMEVQSILDKRRCPIVQIIDDDKGVHLVAAVNLYEAIPECGLQGLEVCRELVEKQVGCAIGVASGSTFCGVTGSSSFACRWDITGPPPVRAARLMQYALQNAIEVVIDHSVYNDPMAATRMELIERAVCVKGTAGTLPVYTLSSSKSYAAFRVLETVHGRVHDGIVNKIVHHIQQDRRKVAVVVSGLPLAGKKIVCQRAAGQADLVPYLHLSDATAGFLQLASTIATWFHYVDNQAVRQLASSVLDHLRNDRLSRAHDACIDLVELALRNGLRACFLVDRVQFLDEFSLSLLRECLCEPKPGERRNSRRNSRTPLVVDVEQLSLAENERGKICFLCVHVSLYNWKSAQDVVSHITRSKTSSSVPIVHLGEAPRDELRTMFRDLSDMEVEDRWLDAYAEASGYCAGYFIERAAAIRLLSGKLWSEGKRPYAETTEELVLHIPKGLVRLNRRLPVTQVSAEVSMRFAQIFDELPPIFQTALKVLSMSGTGFYKLPQRVLWEVLNDLMADGIDSRELEIALDEMVKMNLVKVESSNISNVVSFQSPALSDIAFDVSTPIQVGSIAESLIERLNLCCEGDFRISWVLASLHHTLGHCEDSKRNWVEGYRLFRQECIGWSKRDISKWMEWIDDEITASGFSVRDVLGHDFRFSCPPQKIVGKLLPLLKIYSAPISLGPMGHSLTVLTRNTFHEYGCFRTTPNPEAVAILRKDTKSAADRYLAEMAAVEAFLTDHAFEGDHEELRHEREQLCYIAEPAANVEEVQQKAAAILDEFVPRHVSTRLERLYALVNTLRGGEIPPVIRRASVAIRQAYEAFRVSSKCRSDAAQDALVILATHNWKPKPVPERLPLVHYQTVARIRNKVLKRLSEAELFVFKHQQSHLDLEAFFITTALLSEEDGRRALVCH